MALAHKITPKPRIRLVSILKRTKSRRYSTSPLIESQSLESRFPEDINWIGPKRHPLSNDSSSSSSSSSSESPPRKNKKHKPQKRNFPSKPSSKAKFETGSKSGLKDILKTSRIPPRIVYNSVNRRVSPEVVLKKKKNTQENITVIRTTDVKVPPPKLKSSTSLTGPPLPFRDRGERPLETSGLAQPGFKTSTGWPVAIKPPRGDHYYQKYGSPPLPSKRSKISHPSEIHSKQRSLAASSEARVGSPSPVSSGTHFESLHRRNIDAPPIPISTPSYEDIFPNVVPVQYPWPQPKQHIYPANAPSGQPQGCYYHYGHDYVPSSTLNSAYNVSALPIGYAPYGHIPSSMYTQLLSEPVSTVAPPVMPLSARYPSYANSVNPASFNLESGLSSPAAFKSLQYYPIRTASNEVGSTSSANNATQFGIAPSVPYSSGIGCAPKRCSTIPFGCIKPFSMCSSNDAEYQGSNRQKRLSKQRRHKSNSSTNLNNGPSYVTPTIASSKNTSRKCRKKILLSRKYSPRGLKWGHMEFRRPLGGYCNRC